MLLRYLITKHMDLFAGRRDATTTASRLSGGSPNYSEVEPDTEENVATLQKRPGGKGR